MEVTLGMFVASASAITMGAVLQTSTGLGAGLITVPLLGLISVGFIPGPIIFASMSLSSLMAFRGRTSIDYSNLRILVAGLAAGVVLGAISLSSIPTDRAGIVFGVLVLAAVAISAAGFKIRFTSRNLIAGGVLSGFMGTTAAIGAPVLALLYQHEEGKALRATLGLLYLISSIMMLVFLHVVDRFGMTEFRLGLYLVPGFLLGYVLAAPIAAVLDRGYTRVAVLAISTVSAVVLVLKSL